MTDSTKKNFKRFGKKAVQWGQQMHIRELETPATLCLWVVGGIFIGAAAMIAVFKKDSVQVD